MSSWTVTMVDKRNPSKVRVNVLTFDNRKDAENSYNFHRDYNRYGILADTVILLSEVVQSQGDETLSNRD